MTDKYVWGGGNDTPDPVTNAKLNQNVTYLEELVDSVDGGDGKITVSDGGTPIEDVTSITFSGATVTDNTGGNVTVSGLKGDKGNDGAKGADGATGAKGDDGVPGTPGATGATGAKGDPGEGVPTGGTTGQVLAKASGTDYDTEWVEQTGGGGAPVDVAALQAQILDSILIDDGEVVTSDGHVVYDALGG